MKVATDERQKNMNTGLLSPTYAAVCMLLTVKAVQQSDTFKCCLDVTEPHILSQI